MKKKGAIELSIGTIVVIVLAMSMLILGMVLIRNIFGGATGNIDDLNNKVKDQINKQLGAEPRWIYVHLANKKAEIKQGKEWGVAFAVTNLDEGVAEAESFRYEVSVADPSGVENTCGVGVQDVERWISLGRAGDFSILPGEKNRYYGLVRFDIPTSSPICSVRFNINLLKDGKQFTTEFFDVKVTA
jgi:hypothetical protein